MQRLVEYTLAGLLLAGGMLLRPQPAAAIELGTTCFGVPVTIAQEGGVVHGTGGPDVIVALDAEAVYGYGGDDLICAVGAKDFTPLIDAGSGNDRVHGLTREAAPDLGAAFATLRISGGSGHDDLTSALFVYGGSGNDVISAFSKAFGNAGNDQLATFFGRGFCDGGSGNDVDAGCLTTVNIP